MKDLKVPFAIVSFLLVQGAGAVWWASQVDGRVRTLEAQSLNIARENRRYIEQVIQPSYGINSGWKNQYHDEWVLKGGWKQTVKVDRYYDPYEDLERKCLEELDYIAKSLGGTMCRKTKCNSTGRQSRIIEIEYHVEETRG